MKSSAISIRSSAAGNWQRQSICFGCQKGAVISQLASRLKYILRLNRYLFVNDVIHIVDNIVVSSVVMIIGYIITAAVL